MRRIIDHLERFPGPRVQMAVPTRPNELWSVDFMSDQLANGRRFRILNPVDDYSSKCIGQIADTSISGARWARYLDQLGECQPCPKPWFWTTSPN